MPVFAKWLKREAATASKAKPNPVITDCTVFKPAQTRLAIANGETYAPVRFYIRYHLEGNEKLFAAPRFHKAGVGAARYFLINGKGDSNSLRFGMFELFGGRSDLDIWAIYENPPPDLAQHQNRRHDTAGSDTGDAGGR